MTITRTSRFPNRKDLKPISVRPGTETGFALTDWDRAGIERLLRLGAARYTANPELLGGLLRHKLRISRSAPEPAPDDLVIAGRQVDYMISGGGARSAVLSLEPIPMPGHILVASLLGATLIGMKVMQKAPLLRDDGEIVTVVVLDVYGPRNRQAA